jgi:hypothetical protein
MSGGGGYDFNVGLSSSSTATSGLQQDFRNLFGEMSSGGGGPKWLPVAFLAAAVVVAVVWIVRR